MVSIELPNETVKVRAFVVEGGHHHYAEIIRLKR